MQNKGFFEQFADFPHDLAILCTFTLEQEVIEKLREYCSGQVVIIHDWRQGVTISDNWDQRLLCIPARLPDNARGLFHAKMALLVGSEHAKIIIGSTNLAQASFVFERKEIMSACELRLNHALCGSITEFLRQIPCDHAAWPSIMDKFVVEHYAESVSKTRFIGNSGGKSLAQQLYEFIDEHRAMLGGEPTVRIGSPFLSDNSHIKPHFDEFLARTKASRVNIYTRSTAVGVRQFAGYGDRVGICLPALHELEQSHAKLVSLEYEQGNVLYIGSGNFTVQGFFALPGKGGNCECGCLFLCPGKGMADDWFLRKWAEPRLPGQCELTDGDNEEENEGWDIEPYISASRDGDDVTVDIYDPDDRIKPTPRNIKINDQTIPVEFVAPGHYRAHFRHTGGSLKVDLGRTWKGKELAIFEEARFNRVYDHSANGLFACDEPMESSDERKVAQAVKRDGITVGAGRVRLVEPPVLEKVWQNIRVELRQLSRRMVFTRYHALALQRFLENDERIPRPPSAVRLYKAMHGYRILREKGENAAGLAETCRETALSIAVALGEPPKEFSTFLERWVQYGKI